MSIKQNFLKQFDHIPAKFPIQQLAQSIISNGLEFPTTRDENWKYTRVSSIIEGEYRQEKSNRIPDISKFDLGQLNSIQFVFINGIYSEELSTTSLPEGVHIHAISRLSGLEEQTALKHLGTYGNMEEKAFSALNTGYFTDGAFIEIAKGATIEDPIKVLHLTSGNQRATNVRNLILMGANSKAEFIFQFEGEDNSGCFTNAVNEIVLDEGANGTCYLIQNEGDEAKQINSTQIVQEKNSRFTFLTLTKSGKLVRNNLNFDVLGTGCESNMYGVYFTSGNQHVDNHTYVDHRQENCESNELYKGVMADRSTGVFNGKIMVRKAAQKTNAFQSNQNILLSDKATINTKPELEIYADDVKCSHGCTIGQLDEEAMFYLQSRGLGKEDARKLLIQAFAGDVWEHINNQDVRSDIEAFIQNKFALVHD